MFQKRPSFLIRLFQTGPFIATALLLLIAGCSQTLPDRAERMTRAYIFYLDGAGGGSPLRNWSRGIREGLLDAGYDGAGEMFRWQTGLGMLVDQRSSVQYKRSKAAKLAQQMQEYSQDHPGAVVVLMGMSAGTAVAVFALEALPEGSMVQDVVLLSASLSADYDLTQALRHVRGRMYVSTSVKDGMLGSLVPLAGTADREPGSVPSAGLRGFELPGDATAETRTQYAKVTYIRWTPEFDVLGDKGGHFGTVTPRFIQVCIAPLVMQNAVISSPTIAHASGMVRNPDYERWSRFSAGSWMTMRASQTIGGVRQDLRMTSTLITKQTDLLIVERQYYSDSDRSGKPTRIHGFCVSAWINPSDHPLTSPGVRISDMPPETLQIAGNPLTCQVRSVQANGEFPEYGQNVRATVFRNDSIPGEIAKVSLQSIKENAAFEFMGEVVEFASQ